MQHYNLIGPTDLLDLTFDVDVAKWFALNEWTGHGEYRPKQFRAARSEKQAEADASRIVLAAVRPIGSVPIAEEDWRELTRETSPRLWEGSETEELSQFETPSFNLGPLWSEYPRRQRGFGLCGIGPMDADPNGAILAAWEYLYHPEYFPDGWDHFGGPELTINGDVFAAGKNSAGMSRYLFPDPPDWLTATSKEAVRILKTQR